MKKKLVSILSIILFICLICSIAYAAETNITLQKNKEKYTGGDVVEISVKVNDITLENGIETIIGKISYNEDLYESCVIEESNNWEADYNEQNGKIILQRNEAIKENHTAFVIKLAIKENIVNNDTISFTDINIADENTDLFPQNVTTTITIEKTATGGEEPGDEPEEEQETQPETPSGNQGSGNTDKDTDDKSKYEEIKEDDTKTENKMPNTGVPSVIGLMAIVAMFAVVCLVKYNKYKRI